MQQPVFLPTGKVFALMQDLFCIFFNRETHLRNPHLTTWPAVPYKMFKQSSQLYNKCSTALLSFLKLFFIIAAKCVCCAAPLHHFPTLKCSKFAIHNIKMNVQMPGRKYRLLLDTYKRKGGGAHCNEMQNRVTAWGVSDSSMQVFVNIQILISLLITWATLYNFVIWLS
jgi:hypothetical protein